jgi:hypothetical protein
MAAVREAKQLLEAPVRALAAGVAATAVGPLAVETGESDRPIPIQTTPEQAAAGRGPISLRHLRVGHREGVLPLVILVLPTLVGLEA